MRTQLRTVTVVFFWSSIKKTFIVKKYYMYYVN